MIKWKKHNPKLIKPKVDYLKRSVKSINPFVRLIKEKNSKTIIKEKNIITDARDIKRTIRKIYEQFYANKYDNLDEKRQMHQKT